MVYFIIRSLADWQTSQWEFVGLVQITWLYLITQSFISIKNHAVHMYAFKHKNWIKIGSVVVNIITLMQNKNK